MTFPLQLWRYNEFEFVWRPLQLRQWYGEIVTATRVWNVTGCGNMLGRCTDMNGPVRGVLPHSSMCRT
jgi:hypothetical protein